MTGSLAGKARDAAAPIVLALFAVVCLIGIVRVLLVLGLHVPLDPNEGWNAYHAAAAMAGRPLYPHDYFVNNYPPLSFYLVGLLGRLVGDNIIAGRIVSFIAFVAIAWGVRKAARLMGCRPLAAAFASVFLMAWWIVVTDYVGMNDPQLLGHAIEIAALLVLLESRSDFGAAALFAIALFVKHNLVAMPLATALWLLIEDRARALRFMATGAGFALVGLLGFRALFGFSLLPQLASARIYSPVLLVENTGAWLVWGAVPLLVCVALAIRFPRDKFVRFCVLYAVLGTAIGIIFSGGAGVDANVFFDADIALSLSLGLALDRFGRGTWRMAAIACLLLLPLAGGLYVVSLDNDWRGWDFWAHPFADEAATAQSDIAFLERRPGPAFCESLSLCYWAGKPATVDVFNVGQQLATGARRPDDLLVLIRAHRFTAMEFDALDPFPLGVRVRAAVVAAYHVDHTNDEGVFLVPR